MAFKIGDPARRMKTGSVPIAREGLMIGTVSVLAAVGFHKLGYPVISCLLWNFAAFTLYFFRDPERKIPNDPRAIVAPADGRIARIETIAANAGEAAQIKLSIFLSVFNVHINRCPIGGKVGKVEYKTGSFKNAMNYAASEANEQSRIEIYHNGQLFVVKQMAGLIARRIVCWLRESDEVQKGERLGLIQFGSRVDLLMPENSVKLEGREGDKVKGGLTVLGYLK